MFAITKDSIYRRISPIEFSENGVIFNSAISRHTLYIREGEFSKFLFAIFSFYLVTGNVLLNFIALQAVAVLDAILFWLWGYSITNGLAWFLFVRKFSNLFICLEVLLFIFFDTFFSRSYTFGNSIRTVQRSARGKDSFLIHRRLTIRPYLIFTAKSTKVQMLHGRWANINCLEISSEFYISSFDWIYHMDVNCNRIAWIWHLDYWKIYKKSGKWLGSSVNVSVEVFSRTNFYTKYISWFTHCVAYMKILSRKSWRW